MGHDLVALGEVMLRLAAPPPQRLEQAGMLEVQIGGAEANVAAACARLGLSTALITAFPADHVWGDRAMRAMAAHGVDCSGVVRSAGARMGVYFLEYGALPRPVRVLYDRRDSAASRLTVDQVNWGLVRSARTVHLSGITPALGPSVQEVVRRAIDEARRAGVAVSFDVNYRSRLWSPGAAREFLVENLPRLDYLFIGSGDAKTLFGLSGSPEAVLEGLSRLAPRATIAFTLGEAGSAVLGDGQVWRPRKRPPVTVVDLLGAGDAYAAGFLWGRLCGRSLQDATDAGAAMAALKCTIWGDVPLVTRAELDEVLASDEAEIRR